jgi:hypothetical protein
LHFPSKETKPFLWPFSSTFCSRFNTLQAITWCQENITQENFMLEKLSRVNFTRENFTQAIFTRSEFHAIQNSRDTKITPYVFFPPIWCFHILPLMNYEGRHSWHDGLALLDMTKGSWNLFCPNLFSYFWWNTQILYKCGTRSILNIEEKSKISILFGTYAAIGSHNLE